MVGYSSFVCQFVLGNGHDKAFLVLLSCLLQACTTEGQPRQRFTPRFDRHVRKSVKHDLKTFCLLSRGWHPLNSNPLAC